MHAAENPFDDPNQPPRPEPFRADFSEGLETGLYLALLELIDEGLIITGDDLVLEANASACRLLERSYREIVGQPLAQLFASERAFLDARARLFIQGEMRGSLQVSLPAGRARAMRFIAAARIRPGIHAIILSPDLLADISPDGSLPAAAGTTAGQEVHSDTLWPRLAAVLDQPIIVLDAGRHVSAANAAALRLLKLDRSTLLGAPLSDHLNAVWPPEGESRTVRLQTLGPRPRSVSARLLPGPRPDWQVLVLPLDNTARVTTQIPTPFSPSRNATTAIARHQLSLHYQALVDVRQNRVHAAEALLRWQHPTSGTTSFGQMHRFIHDPVEIARLSDWALQTACREAAQWPQHNGRGTRLTVNVSTTQAMQPDMLSRVELALSNSGLPPEHLELDLDDNILCEAEEQLVPLLDALRGLGVHLAIDDFGRSPTPIARLKRLPIEALKLDPALVRKVGHDEHSEATVEAIVSMGNVLGLQVLARGVEDRAQRDFLAALGCHLQQGPLYGQAVPARDFSASLPS